MKAYGYFTSKKYFKRVLFSIMLTMALILTGLSAVNTYLLERSVKNVQEEANLKVLTQTQYNLSYMNEIIVHLSSFAYRDNALIPLMFSSSLPKMDYIRGYQQMYNMLESSSFLHMMSVYNATSGELYGSSSDFLVDGGTTKSSILQWLLHTNDSLPASRLIPFSFSNSNGIDAFAFIVTDTYRPFTPDQSAIILFIKPDWVFESLSKLNGTGNGNTGDILIQTSSGQLFESGDSSQTFNQEDIGRLIRNDNAGEPSESGFVIGKAGGQKVMVTYLRGIGDWTILYMQPYKQLMQAVSDMRTRNLMLTGAFILISIGISIWLSYKLYGPIETMMKRILPHMRNIQEPSPRSRSELDAMSDVYEQLSGQLQEISSEQIVRKYYIRKFLTDSRSLSEMDMRQLIMKHELQLAPSGPYMVCTLRLDRYDEYERRTSPEMKKLHSFAITNITKEIMSQTFGCEIIDMQQDHFTFILSGMPLDIAVIKPLIADVQQVLDRYYSLSLTCGISDSTGQLNQLSSSYYQSYQLSQYSILMGYQATIEAQNIRTNLDNKQKSLPDDVEKKLSEAIRKGKLTDAGSELERAFDILAKLQLEDMRRAISDMAWIIKNAAADITSNRITHLSMDVERIPLLPQDYYTLDELHMAFLSLCTAICEEAKPSSMERNEMIIETVKELIWQKYADYNLNQQSIAATVKLSSAYVGKLFKDSCGLTITEYLNDVRLSRAQDLLLKEDSTIMEIMEKVGYGNQSYFFRLFKSKFGSTPKEFRIKKSIS
ncbi:AraC family transcriptional regulator [Paenibacillus lupini]|uniref:helix-turn-helix domain-containing protein n=1 Tax=Paenibacillus lupini TaxID=1450204 RepID=UPI00142060ED|nr:AraC family transcriptional regulator [Paenibacillus lupini]NIK23523.1 AraC-like DNA-binding protein [Paenibacillus lupini]